MGAPAHSAWDDRQVATKKFLTTEVTEVTEDSWLGFSVSSVSSVVKNRSLSKINLRAEFEESSVHDTRRRQPPGSVVQIY